MRGKEGERGERRGREERGEGWGRGEGGERKSDGDNTRRGRAERADGCSDYLYFGDCAQRACAELKSNWAGTKHAFDTN